MCLDNRWDNMFNLLLEFKQKHGHVKVPQQYNENKKLGRWVSNSRSDYREYKRTNGQKGDPDRMKRLESIGLFDDISTGYAKVDVNKNWHDMYNQLLEFKQKHGHVKVPQQYNENKKLGIRVKNWRRNYREYKRTNGQKGDPGWMKRLESIGLVDDITTGYAKVDFNKNWHDMYNQLLEFKQKHGHVKVPQQYDENKKLGLWVRERRRNYREYKRSNRKKGDPEQMKCLEKIGMVDDISTEDAKRCSKNSRWNDMFNLLLEFKQKHGHVKVPQQYDENPKLGRWVMHNRSSYREYKRSNGQKGDPERMKCLESIGMADDISTKVAKRCSKNSRWDDMFNLLSEFKQKHGHVKVPQQYDENPKLGRWVMHNRKNYREYKRSNGQKGDPERMKCLESIGLVGDIIKKYEDKMTNCADNKVFAPIIVSSMSPTLSSNTSTVKTDK
jgi:hypothetical protein